MPSQLRLLAILLLFTKGAPLSAAPWISPEDQFLVNSINVLANAGYIKSTTTTYPLLWKNIVKDLYQIEPSELRGIHQQAYYQLKNAADFANGNYSQLVLSSSSEDLLNMGQGYQYKGDASVKLGTDIAGNNWAAGIKGQYSKNPTLHRAADVSGSYASFIAGNWVLSVSQQQQWWGASKDTSFSPSLFSHPARVIQLNRFEQTSFSSLPFSETPWQLQIQYGELTGDALFPNRRFSSTRLTAKPTTKLEVSLDYIDWQAQQHHFFNEQPYSVVSSSDKALDFKYALTPKTSLYGRAGKGDSNDFWMLGNSYYFGNQRYMWNLYAEYQRNDRKSYLNQLQPQLLEPELLINLTVKERAVIGLTLQTPRGNNIYSKLRHINYDAQALDPTHRQYRESFQLHSGSQFEVAGGLMSVDGVFRYNKYYNPGSTKPRGNLSTSLGVRWEIRF